MRIHSSTVQLVTLLLFVDGVVTLGACGGDGKPSTSLGAAGIASAAGGMQMTVAGSRSGKTIWVDDSCGVSAMADSWSSSSAATLDQRITSGVIAFAHCGAPSGNYQSATSALSAQLMNTCF